MKVTQSETDMHGTQREREREWGEEHVTSLKAVWLQRISKIVTLGF